MSKLKSPINYKSLEKELQEALRVDELYKLQNDAKLRAVEQNVPTYEDFRQMVCGAHLKPLQRNDVQPNATGSWNPVVCSPNGNCRQTISRNETFTNQPFNERKSDGMLKGDENTPVTYQRFRKVWNTIEGCEGKFHFLKSVRNDLQEHIFFTEIPSSLFAEIIEVCLENISIAENVEIIFDVLHILSKCNRFGLTVSFMESKEWKICAELFHRLLLEMTSRDESIRTLASAYGIPFENTERNSNTMKLEN